MCECCVLSEGAVWCAVWRRQKLLYCDMCLCCLLSQVVAVIGPFRPVSSSASVVSEGPVAAKRSSHVCEGELCGASSPSVRLGWLGHACSPSAPPPLSMVFNTLT